MEPARAFPSMNPPELSHSQSLVSFGKDPLIHAPPAVAALGFSDLSKPHVLFFTGIGTARSPSRFDSSNLP